MHISPTTTDWRPNLGRDRHGPGTVDFYGADPHSPWQRGVSENANRPLRFWLRESTDLTVHTQARLDQICEILNSQPRRSLA